MLPSITYNYLALPYLNAYVVKSHFTSSYLTTCAGDCGELYPCFNRPSPSFDATFQATSVGWEEQHTGLHDRSFSFSLFSL